MKYLVVRPHKSGLSAVSIMDGDAVVTGPHEAWALDSGKAIVFANTKLHQQMKQFYVGGQFQDRAIYTYSYEEVCHIVSHGIGPSDRQRYERLQNEIGHGPKPRAESGESRAWLAALFTSEVLWTVLHAFWKIVGLLFFILILPFVIMFVNKQK